MRLLTEGPSLLCEAALRSISSDSKFDARIFESLEL
jgi:hypothetical protein